jgi:L-ascorbate metabolism protein UlaG (beta-lactamase superfamily)
MSRGDISWGVKISYQLTITFILHLSQSKIAIPLIMKITYLGHSCFQIELKEHTLLIDPFISGNPKVENKDLSGFNPDYILLTHGHTDHTLDAETIAKNSGAHIISNYEIVSWYSEKGIEGTGMNHGGASKFPFGRLKYVTAIHSSSLPEGSYGGNPGGFVLELEGTTIYVAGDTALTMDMKLIPMTGPKPDICILPVGDFFTMGIDDAIVASDWVECNKVIGCHFDTFPPIEIDQMQAIGKFESKGKTLILPKIGQVMEI